MTTATDDLSRRLDAYMEKLKMRSTTQRKVVSEVFFGASGHLSIEELLELVRERDPRIGYATVYRTLKLMRDAGVASERHFSDGISRYEIHSGDDHHDHLICVKCGTIVEFEDDNIERLQDELARRHGFELHRHIHELYGTCRACRACRSPAD